MKAMIMGAGFGTRLRPLTDSLPKPLVPLCNRPLLDYTTAFLHRSGVTAAIINTHYLADQIAAYVDARGPRDLPLHVSYEREILNLGGGLKRAEGFLRDSDPFLVVHGDVVAMFDLDAALAEHRARNALVTMLLCDRGASDGGGPIPTVDLGHDGRVATIAERPAGSPVPSGTMQVFSGVHIVSPRIFEAIPDAQPICLVRRIYPECIAAGERVLGTVVPGFWSDLGTPESYLATNFHFLRFRSQVERFFGLAFEDEAGIARVQEPSLIGRRCEIAESAEIGPFAVIGDQVRVSPGVRVHHSVVWPGVLVETDLDRVVAHR